MFILSTAYFGLELLIKGRDEQVKINHARLALIMAFHDRRDLNDDMIDNDGEREILNGKQKGKFCGTDSKRAEHAAATRRASRGRLDNVIYLIVCMNNIQVPPSLIRRIPRLRKRARPMGTIQYSPTTKARRNFYSSDEEERAAASVAFARPAAAQQELSKEETFLAEIPRRMIARRHKKRVYQK